MTSLSRDNARMIVPFERWNSIRGISTSNIKVHYHISLDFLFQLISRQTGGNYIDFHIVENGNCITLRIIFITFLGCRYRLFSAKFMPIASSTTFSSDVRSRYLHFLQISVSRFAVDYYTLCLTNRYTNVTSKYLMNFECFAR